MLFAYLTDADFFAIDVMNHGDWARQRSLEIINHNWPDLIALYRIRALGLEFTPSDSDIKKLRSAHVQSMTDIDGVVYGPPGLGYATDGTSVEVVLRHQKAQRILRTVQDHIVRNLDQLVELARNKGCAMAPPYQFKLFSVDSAQIHVIEVNSNAIFPFRLNS